MKICQFLNNSIIFFGLQNLRNLIFDCDASWDIAKFMRDPVRVDTRYFNCLFWFLVHEWSPDIITIYLPRFQGVKCAAQAAAAENLVAKSLDNIVGKMWQQKHESSGSSVGNQVRIFRKSLIKRLIKILLSRTFSLFMNLLPRITFEFFDQINAEICWAGKLNFHFPFRTNFARLYEQIDSEMVLD